MIEQDDIPRLHARIKRIMEDVRDEKILLDTGLAQTKHIRGIIGKLTEISNE